MKNRINIPFRCHIKTDLPPQRTRDISGTIGGDKGDIKSATMHELEDGLYEFTGTLTSSLKDLHESHHEDDEFDEFVQYLIDEIISEYTNSVLPKMVTIHWGMDYSFGEPHFD